jgi:hypothetical protein
MKKTRKSWANKCLAVCPYCGSNGTGYEDSTIDGNGNEIYPSGAVEYDLWNIVSHGQTLDEIEWGVKCHACENSWTEYLRLARREE